MRLGKLAKQRGSVLMELAITVPLFLVILIGMLEYGYYFYVAVSASSAAREGARQCTLVALGGCGDCDPTNAIGYMDKIGLGSKTTATATCASNSGDIAYTVNVRVDFPTLTKYPVVLAAMPASAISGNSVAYGTAVMRGQ